MRLDFCRCLKISRAASLMQINTPNPQTRLTWDTCQRPYTRHLPYSVQLNRSSTFSWPVHHILSRFRLVPGVFYTSDLDSSLYFPQTVCLTVPVVYNIAMEWSEVSRKGVHRSKPIYLLQSTIQSDPTWFYVLASNPIGLDLKIQSNLIQFKAGLDWFKTNACLQINFTLFFKKKI